MHKQFAQETENWSRIVTISTKADAVKIETSSLGKNVNKGELYQSEITLDAFQMDALRQFFANEKAAN